ncbi:MAG: DEAD/DEAH box helicase, partial [Clostridia bacterium]|nr:DEAD/DEAH box helicase [Clostridia bacterium]
GIRPSSCDKYLPVAYGERVTLLDYCPNDLLCICESADVRRAFERTQKQFALELKAMFENGVLAKGLDAYGLTEPGWLLQYEKRNAIYADVFARGSFDTPVSALINFSVRRTARWDGTLAHLLEDLRPALSHGTRCVVKAGTEKAAASLAEALETEDVNAIYLSVPPAEFPAKTVTVLPGVLSGGFALPGEDFLLISYGGTGAEPARKRRKGYRAADAVQSLDELHRGDTVVHVVHGIGVFEGIKQLDVSGLRKDYITIRYAGGDTLYVPVTQLDLVSKYIGPHEDGREVRLSKLGGDAWNRTKARVKASAKSIARDLIALYAKRQSTPGFAFSPDIDMQNDFERRFEFDETEDQLKTAAEIKHDMEQPHPMDRLLCGDVGFGKTEVALRAAFKCVADGKQCAILVPTTILALQHYNTITRRFEGFPVETEMLSRFRSAKEQTAILKKLRRGEIDIVVGTHRLISKDVQFRDLGLIIVDEEQRFGVGQKEKLKELYPDVDCLTLSATPIPRTMNMAMSGIRDMSVIEEAPQDRFPVQTYVLEHDWGIIAEAVSKELRRGGQVYYLNNSIESIPATVSKLQELVPGAVI